VYVPHPFSSYATRYGVIGAVFAMISALFCVTVVVVGSAAVGREISGELGRIRRGERLAEDEVRRQWDEITAQARSQWETLQERRRTGHGKAMIVSPAMGSRAGVPARFRCSTRGTRAVHATRRRSLLPDRYSAGHG
jgi:hypothetical protein